MKKKGFTMLEILVVVGIIAILVGIALPRFRNTLQRTKEARTEADLEAIKTAAVMYHYDSGEWPDPANSGDELIATTGNGPYLDVWRADPWGDPYELVVENADDLIAVSGGGSAITIPTADPNISLLITRDNTQ